MAKPRDYTYDTAYESTEKQKKNRAQRNKARRMLMQEGKVTKGDGLDVDHIKSMKTGGTTTKSNLRVRSVKANRGDKTF